ncbi:unnamed protein product [Prunus brigantina]
MGVFEDKMDNIDSEDEEAHDQNSVVVKRFNFDDLYLSDSDDSSLEAQPCLMEKDEIKNQISALETDLKTESQSISAIFRVERYREERCEMERKLDTQYQRNIAEAHHLTAVQRDLEVRSQTEERKIRIDAAYKDAKRREKALQEEKLRQERAKAEAEAKRAEDAKGAALEAQRRAANEAAEREASEASNRADSGLAHEGTYRPQINVLNAQSSGKPPAAGNILKAAESALNLEQGRLQKLKQFDDENQGTEITLQRVLLAPKH